MITPLQSPSSTSVAQGKGSAPYAGPERRVADRRRSNDGSPRTGGFHELGPYLHERRQPSTRVTPAATRAHTATFVVAAPAAGAATFVVAAPAEAATTFEVLDEAFIMAEAIVAEHSTLHPRAETELPWITAFLDDVAESHAPSALDFASDADSAPAALTASVPDAAAFDLNTGRAAGDAELWPLDDAGSRMRELADALESHTGPHDASSAQRHDARVSSGDSVAPLAMWSDDDFVDVMPVHAMSLPAVGAPTRVAPAEDRQAAHESAALALEALARRVRRREVSVPTFDPELGDAAALATALVVLLAPRA